MRSRALFCVFLGALLLTSCGGDGSAERDEAMADPAAGGGAAAPVSVGGATLSGPTVLARNDDVVIDSCELNAGGATVVRATVTNSGGGVASYIATVEISQNGDRVDGVGLIAGGLAAGARAKASQTGLKTGLKGPVQCTVVDVSAVSR